MRIFIFILFLITALRSEAQLYRITEADSPGEYENVFVEKLYSDSLTTTFIIWVKKVVPLHKHAYHTEQLLILEGSGEMTIGEDTFQIKAGDFLVIPKDMPHALIVTSAIPMKVISIQAPEFDGSDRIILGK